MSIWRRLLGDAEGVALGAPIGVILGVMTGSAFDRKKWIQLNKEHHPDNLIARGMPKEFIEQSNKELAAINLAYDKIKEIRAKS